MDITIEGGARCGGIGARLLIEGPLQRMLKFGGSRQLNVAVEGPEAEPQENFFNWHPFYIAEILCLLCLTTFIHQTIYHIKVQI